MDERVLSSRLTVYLSRIADSYWERMLLMVETTACSHWAKVVRGKPQGPETDPRSTVLWLHPKRDTIATAYLLTVASLCEAFQVVEDARVRLDHGAVWNLVLDLYDGKVTDFTDHDIDVLVQVYLLGGVRYTR